jgi:hypothetical protein
VEVSVDVGVVEAGELQAARANVKAIKTNKIRFIFFLRRYSGETISPRRPNNDSKRLFALHAILRDISKQYITKLP